MIALDRPLDFILPPELEATEPPESRGLRRDQVRLLVSYLGDDRIVHARFSDMPDFLRPGDLLVANDSATLPAALTACRSNGAEITISPNRSGSSSRGRPRSSRAKYSRYRRTERSRSGTGTLIPSGFGPPVSTWSRRYWPTSSAGDGQSPIPT